MAAANYSKEAMDDFINRSMGSSAATTPAPAPTVTEPIKVESRNFADTHRSNIISIQSEIEKNKNNPKNIKILNDELAREQANLSGAQNTEMDKFIEAGMKESTTPAGQQLASEIDKLQPSRFVNIVAPPKSEEQQLAEARTKGMPINPQIAAQGQRGRALRTEEPPVNAVGQLARALLQNPVVRPLAAVSGVIGGLIHAAKTGESPEPPAEDIRKALVEQYTYVPPGERGRELLQTVASIPEKITGSSMGFPPFTGIGPGTVLAPAVVSQVAPTVTKGVVSAAQGIGRAAEGVEQAVKKTGEFVGEVGAARRQMVDQFAQKRAPIVPPVVEAAEGPVMKGGGAAVSNLNPYPQFTGQDVGKGELFPVVKSSQIASNVPANEQALRAQIASEVTKSNQVRTGVITGNEDILRNEHTEAASPNPSVKGQLLKSQIANEQNGLRNFAEDRIKATGASENLVNETQRGERINDVFYGKQEAGEAPTTLQSYLDQAKKQVYDSARQIHGDKPTLSTNFNTLINDEQWQAGLSLNEKQGIAATAQKFMNLADTKGFKDINGVLQPAGSVSAKDAVRKALNKKWTHENANVIREINQAIDMDIAAVADPKLYKLGDRIHQAEKNIYDTKGIKKLFGEVDEKGIVRSKTALDKVTSTLNDLPKDEWKHIRSTLDDLSKGVVRNAPEGMPPVPDSLRQSAAAAVKEIDGALAREVFRAGAKDQGVWNQNRATNILNSRVGEKIHETFPPNEVVNFHKLNYAGHFMPGKHVYEGAALQGQRVQGIIESNLGKLGATIGASAGGFLAGPPGVAAGTYMGGQLGLKGAAAMEAKALQKSAETLQKEMKRNAQLGKNNIKDIGK
jgi:hypothetical protein